MFVETGEGPEGGGRIFGAVGSGLNREGAKNEKGLLVVCSGDNTLPLLGVLCVLS